MQKGVLTKPGRERTREIIFNYALYFILGILIIGIIAYDPTFLTKKNFINILTQASTRAILALGAAGLIVLQGTDLSAGRILGLSAAVSASMLQSLDYASRMYPNLGEVNMLIPFALAIAVAVVFSLFNGFGVAVLKIHAFIISLGTQLIVYGLLQMYIDSQEMGAQPIGSLSKKYVDLVNGQVFLLPNLVWFMIIISLIMWVVWNKTELGKNMFAIGGNPEAAEVSGVSLVKNIMLIYLITGVLYGIAGFLEAARIGSVTAGTGTNYDLDAIAACVVGGVSFSGGVGTIPGVLIGTTILQFINYGLQYIGVNPYLQGVVKGIIIIVAVAIDVRKYIKKK